MGSVSLFWEQSDATGFSVVATQFCYCSKKATTDYSSTIKCGCVAIKIHLWTQKFEL